MDIIQYIFLFLIGTTILNFCIAIGARVNTGNKQFNLLIFYWVTLFLTYIAVAFLGQSVRQISFAYFLQVIPTFVQAKILMESRGNPLNLKYYGAIWAVTAVISAGLILFTDVGFTLSLLPVALGTNLVLITSVYKTLFKSGSEANWIEKGMAYMFITAIINHFNYAFFRMVPGTEWWGWSISIAQYQCFSIFLPLLINHRRAEIERKNIEQALEKLSGSATKYNVEIDDLYRDLELQIFQKEELTHKLTNANASLEEEREMNEILIKTVSHDLANPLTVVNAYVDMMCMGRVPDVDKEKILGKIKLNTNAALDMISRIRNAIVTRNQAALVATHDVSIDRAIHKLLDSFESRINAKKIKVTYENNVPLDTFIQAEENALTEHVFANILSNSIKFSHENSELIIKVDEDSEGIKVTFRDYGIGISKSRLERRLLHSTEGTKGEPGSGFGVMVMGYFLRKFGGTHHIHSDGEGKGTTVTISLKKSKSFRTKFNTVRPSANIFS